MIVHEVTNDKRSKNMLLCKKNLECFFIFSNDTEKRNCYTVYKKYQCKQALILFKKLTFQLCL